MSNGMRLVDERQLYQEDQPKHPVLDMIDAPQGDGQHRLSAFVHDRSGVMALVRLLYGRQTADGLPERDVLLKRASELIARIDRLLADQIDALLHHPRFQALESAWRGIHYIVSVSDEFRDEARLKVKLLQAPWAELARDLEKCIEFDQSALFQKVYTDEYDHPGGEPFGLLIGDYQVSHKPRPDSRVNDVQALSNIAQVAAAAFVPFISNPHPSLFGLDDFAELGPHLNLDNTFKQVEYTAWRSLRQHEDSRFIGLVMPRVLMRRPHRQTASKNGLVYAEKVASASRDYVWGGAAFSFAGVAIRAFAETGWFAQIRGVHKEALNSGLVGDLPGADFSTDRAELVQRCHTSAFIGSNLEKQLSELGFIPLSYCAGTHYSMFFSNNSIQQPQSYDRDQANINARLSIMLQYLLCVSRFAHYMKVMGRDKVGAFATPDACQRYFQQWLHRYTTANEHLSFEMKAKHPLSEASVQVSEKPGQPGRYVATIHLQPHFQLDELTTGIRLVTELVDFSKG